MSIHVPIMLWMGKLDILSERMDKLEAKQDGIIHSTMAASTTRLSRSSSEPRTVLAGWNPVSPMST